MRALLLAALLIAFPAFAEETDEQPVPTLNIQELLQKPEMSVKPKAKKPQPAVTKGASYLLTYKGDDGNWYEDEAVATGRSAVYCDGVRYEVETEDFTYFAKPKELRRIRGVRR